MASLEELLAATAARHSHLCPRQVLGVRMGRLAAQVLQLDLPQRDKRLLTIVETDGCFTDGIAVSTGCWVGRRTMRVEDLGRVAATFVDTATRQSVRMAPRDEARVLAPNYAPEADNAWEAYLIGYQRMPDEELLSVQEVQLLASIGSIISRPDVRATCQVCGEEIINEREIARDGITLCKHCAGQSYYRASGV